MNKCAHVSFMQVNQHESNELYFCSANYHEKNREGKSEDDDVHVSPLRRSLPFRLIHIPLFVILNHAQSL